MFTLTNTNPENPKDTTTIKFDTLDQKVAYIIKESRFTAKVASSYRGALGKEEIEAAKIALYKKRMEYYKSTLVPTDQEQA